MAISFDLEIPLWPTESVNAQPITFKRASWSERAAQKNTRSRLC
jgi:hypothetical protein